MKTYSKLIELRSMCLYRLDEAQLIEDANYYVRYCKLLSYIEGKLREIPATNTFKPCKITFWHLSRMCDNVLAKERAELDKGNWKRAASLSLVWARIMKAMINPYYFEA